MLSMLQPERHDVFSWTGRPEKKYLLSAYCLRVSAAKIFASFYETSGVTE
jgi:hypothetical protein